jgi:sugar lactone lactonase YvrE
MMKATENPMSRKILLSFALGAILLATSGCGNKSDGPTAPVPQPLSIKSGDLVLTDSHNGVGRLVAVDSAGVQRVVASGGKLKYPSGLAFTSNGDIVVAEEVGDTLGGVYRISRSTGAQTTITAGGLVRRPSGIAVGPNDEIYVACYVPDSVFGAGTGEAGTVVRLDPVTGAPTVLTNRELTITYGLALEISGNLLVNTGLFSAAVTRVDAVTYSDAAVSAGGSLTPLLLGVAIESSGSIIVVGDGTGVVRLDAITGAQTVVSTGGEFQTPFGVAIDGNGRIVVADAAGGITRVDPTTGAQTRFSWNGQIYSPTGIAVVP